MTAADAVADQVLNMRALIPLGDSLFDVAGRDDPEAFQVPADAKAHHLYVCVV